jgi:hypothetical protein
MAFETERKKATFPVKELSYMFCGNQEGFEKFQKI